MLAVTFLDALSGLGQFLLASAIAFVAVAFLVSRLRFERLAALATDRKSDDLEPADAFGLQIADRLGRGPREQRPFSVLFIAPDRADAHTPPIDLFPKLLPALRTYVRKSDAVEPYDSHCLGVLIDAAREDIDGVVTRVFHEAGKSPSLLVDDSTSPASVSAGLATSPENGTRVAVLTEAARAALGRALSGHGRFAYEKAPVERPASEKASTDRRVHSNIDPVTGVLRADRLMAAAQRYIAPYRKRTQPVSAVFVAVDRFARYREHYDDEQLTALLRELAQLLEEHVRLDDLLARYDQEGFMILAGCDCRSAHGIAVRLGELVRRSVFLPAASKLKLAITCGVAGYPEHGGVPRVLLESARVARDAAVASRELCLVYEKSMRARTVADRPVDSL